MATIACRTLFAIFLLSFQGGVIGDNLKRIIGNPLSDNESRIIGGRPIPIGQVRYQVALIIPSNGVFSLRCGGTLVRTDLVITAGRCVQSTPISALRAYAGMENIWDLNVYRMPQRIVIYSGVTDNAYINNIGLIKLESSFPTGSSINPINYATNSIPLGLNCIITGWGKTNINNTASSQYLIAANVTTANRAQCEAAHSGLTVSWNNTLCASSSTNPLQDICAGDEGGPLVCNNVLVGISSFSKCGTGSSPSLSGYTDVSRFDQWIRDNGSGKIGINYLLITSMMLLIFINISNQ